MKVFVALTQYFSGHAGKQMQKDPASVDIPIPNGSCSTESSSPLMFEALP